MEKKPFYITTTLPYVNAEPHIGFAAELVHADILARYHRDILKEDVFFNTGTDEHGIKIYRNAIAAGFPIYGIQEYADLYADKFKTLCEKLNISNDSFVRTTHPNHKKAAQEFWKKCYEAGDIYPKKYKIKYCVGCELEKTDSELVNGKCPIHPNLELEIIEEENYFFKFSKYREFLLKLYDNHKFILPMSRLIEIKAFVERGLEDFSISRLKSKMPWGIDVPGDPNHVMYVWFDALVNYVDAIGWPSNMEKFEKWWPAVQIAGKDNLRQQSAMWQAMLKSAGLPPSKQIIIRGFITSGGQKMSKSLGNVTSPDTLINELISIQGINPKLVIDAVRYFLVRDVNPFEDSDVTLERFKELYNSGLSKGLGNLVSRIMQMASQNLDKPVPLKKYIPTILFKSAFDDSNIQAVAVQIQMYVSNLDEEIEKERPFTMLKTDKTKAVRIIKGLVEKLSILADMLIPLMPETSKIILDLIKENKMPEKPLFARRD